MSPRSGEEADFHPEDAQRLELSGPVDSAAVHWIEPEILTDAHHGFLGFRIVTAKKHGRRPLVEFRVDHAEVTDRVERLHHVCVLEPSLNLLATGVGVPKREAGRRSLLEYERVCRIDHGFPGEVLGAG